MSDKLKYKCAYDKLMNLRELKENPRNPNKHPYRQIEILAKIIDFQGQRAPIVVSSRSGLIIKGHGRLRALKKLGWPQAAVDFQDYDNEAEEYADMVADNKIAELAEHDDFMMIEGIKDLELTTMDFEMLGLDDFTIDDDLITEVNRGNENSEWVGLPDFDLADKEIKLHLVFKTEEEREEFVTKHDINITAKMNKQWISRF